MTRIACHIVSLVLFGTSITAVAEVIEPIITEESLPEAAGECNLRMSATYHADVFEPATALPRAQLFCGFSRRWGGEIDVPLAREEGRYGVASAAVAVKYKLRGETSHIPALVLGMEAKFPTGQGESGVEAGPFIAVFKQVHGLSLQGNIGLGLRHSGREREYLRAYNGAVAIPLRHTGFALVGEVNAESSRSGTMRAFSPGVHYSLGKNRYVAFAWPISASQGSARAGLVFLFQTRVRGGEAAD